MTILKRKTMEDLAPLTAVLARGLLAQVFLLAAFSKFLNPDITLEYMRNHGMPAAQFFYTVALVFEVTGGFLLLFGYKTRFGACLLIAFLIPVTLIFHTEYTDPIELIMYRKNLAVMGGLLYIVLNGAGPWSMDARRNRG